MAIYKVVEYIVEQGQALLQVDDTFEWEDDFFHLTMPISRKKPPGQKEPVTMQFEPCEWVGEYDEGYVYVWGFSGISGSMRRSNAYTDDDTGSFQAVQVGLAPSDSRPDSLLEPLPHAMI